VIKLSEIISPKQFRDLADYLDIQDRKLGIKGNEVQQDLRRFADELELFEELNPFIESEECNDKLYLKHIYVLCRKRRGQINPIK